MEQLPHTRWAVIISSDIEWQETCRLLGVTDARRSALGEWFMRDYITTARAVPEGVLFFHGGWGKVAAAASCQYVIDQCRPAVLLNIGTCGGLAGRITTESLVLVEQTIVYDIFEQMGDQDQHIRHYTTDIDLSWLKEPLPMTVIKTLMLSADQDIKSENVPLLIERFGAVVADWESAAIAWVCARHGVPCLILRGVSDLVGTDHGEAYGGDVDFFRSRARQVLVGILDNLSEWFIHITDSCREMCLNGVPGAPFRPEDCPVTHCENCPDDRNAT